MLRVAKWGPSELPSSGWLACKLPTACGVLFSHLSREELDRISRKTKGFLQFLWTTVSKGKKKSRIPRIQDECCDIMISALEEFLLVGKGLPLKV